MEHGRVEVTLAPAPADVAALEAGMRAYELSVLPYLPDESADIALHAFVHDGDGRVLGGVRGNCFWDGVEIDVVWVDDAARGRGLGTALMEAVEAEARRRGAVVAYLKTVMARAFYERLGYVVFGVLEDRPIGTELFFMKKRLDA